MGTDIIIKSNHSLDFKYKSATFIVQEILTILHDIDYKGLESFFECHFEKENFYGSKVYYKINEDFGFNGFKDDDYINIESNSDGGSPSINIEEFQCCFILPYRYRTWCIVESISPYDWRNQWRKYIWLTIKALGGNRAVYLADNGHPLENFRYLAMPLDDVEKALENKFGLPASSLEIAYNNTIVGRNLYYIDHFEDFANLI